MWYKAAAVIVDPRQKQVVRHLWDEGRLSRSELHLRTGLTPNGVGAVADVLLREGLLRECPAEPSTGGRPRVPLEIDPARRNVVGLAIGPGRVEVTRLGLRGGVLGSPVLRAVSDPQKIVSTARDLLKRTLGPETLGIGVSATGFVDAQARAILFSSAMPGRRSVSLAPLYDAAGDVPIVLENDMHALAARWMLSHRADEHQDVLLVAFDDGRVGAGLLVEGRPNHGCVTGANELGHTRFPVETVTCYCGQSGCLERIISSDYLARLNGSSGTDLAERVTRFRSNDAGVETITRHLAMALSNAVNFIRPARLVLVSRLVRQPAFTDLLVRSIRSLMLVELADRVRIDLWDEPAQRTAETAGWLALASLFREGWSRSGG